MTFNEAMGTGVTTAANYTVSGTGKGTLANNPNSVALVAGNTYRLTWSSGEMLNGGNITVTVANAQDVAGNAIGATNNSATATGTAIGVAPTVTINQAGGQADPTGTSPINFTVVFSEATTTFATGDVTITGTAGGTKTATVTGSGTTYNVAVTGMTTAGTIIASINAGVATDAAGNNNTASTSTDNTVTWNGVDSTPPQVSSVTVQTGLIVDIAFNEAMGTGVTTAANYTVSGTGKGTLANNPNSVALVAGNNYRLTWSSGEMLNGGNITVTVANAQDVAGNAIGATNNSATATGTAIGVAPTVTINQAGAQTDPTSTSPINFTVVFSEATTTFATGDVTITGTAGGTKTATVTGSGTTYNVAVTGMTTSGTVIASIGAGVATDAAGNNNTASTSTDNSVQWTAAPVCTRNAPTVSMPATGPLAAGQDRVYSVMVTNNDTAACSAATFALALVPETNSYPASFTTPSTLAASTTGLLSPGSQYLTTLTVSAKAGATLGNTLTSTINATEASHATGSASVITTISPLTSPLIHNSDNLGTGKGTWGLSFNCATCHSANTSNVKRIAQQVNTPYGLRTVTFTRMTASKLDNAAIGVFGNDNRTYAVDASTNICEVCHRNTSYHQYSSANITAPNKNHRLANNSDCTRCHSHQAGFKGSGHGFPFPGATHMVGLTPPTYATCLACHVDTSGSYPATGGAPPNCTGCHTNAATFNSASAGCQDCHGVNNASALIAGRPTGAAFPDIAGSHNVSGHVGVDCATCHSAAGTGTLLHGSQNRTAKTRADVTVAFSGAAGAGVWNGSVDLTCTTINCHDDGTGVLVETPMWGSAPPLCTACHNSRPATGSHTEHLSGTNINCASCHNGAVEGTTASAQHLNGKIDVFKTTAGDFGPGYPAAGKTKGSPYATCTTALCHVDPSSVSGVGGVPTQKISPTWGDTTGIRCNYCHLSRPTTGSHSAHYTAGFAQCVNCHNGAVESATLSTGHNNNAIDVYKTTPGDMGYPAAKAIGSAYNKCSTGSCHEDGRGNFVASPTWGTANNDCSACHANLPATGSHVQHITGVGVTCGQCHKGAVQGSTWSNLHLNGFVDVYATVEGDLGYPARKAKNSPYQACTTANCHGRLSPVWGGNTSNYQCTKCHGMGVALANYSSATSKQSAPGYAGVGVGVGRQTGTVTSNVSSDPKVGAHDTHMRSLNNIGKPAACNDCHVVPGTAFVAGHMNGSSLPTWSNLVQNIETTPGSAVPYTYTRGAKVPMYDSLTGTCSATYCHGSAIVDGANTAPKWNETGYLTGVRSHDCAQCHGYPPVNSPKQPHNPPADFMTCTNCHPHDGSRTSTDPLLGSDFHMNGHLEANKFCNACHDYDTRGTGGTIWGKNQMGVESFGAHAMHINYLKGRMNVTAMDADFDGFGSVNFNGICGVCHSRNIANHNQGNRTTALRNITFGDLTAVKRQFGPNPPTYNGTTYVSSATTPKTCSNIDCHYKTSPVWQPF